MMIYLFQPDKFVGKSPSDNTLDGLFRRMKQAGQRAELVGDAVGIEYNPEAGDETTWVTSVEKHFGCKLTAEV